MGRGWLSEIRNFDQLRLRCTMIIQISTSVNLSAVARTVLMKTLSLNAAKALQQPESNLSIALNSDAGIVIGGKYELCTSSDLFCSVSDLICFPQQICPECCSNCCNRIPSSENVCIRATSQHLCCFSIWTACGTWPHQVYLHKELYQRIPQQPNLTLSYVECFSVDSIGCQLFLKKKQFSILSRSCQRHE